MFNLYSSSELHPRLYSALNNNKFTSQWFERCQWLERRLEERLWDETGKIKFHIIYWFGLSKKVKLELQQCSQNNYKDFHCL